MVLILVIYLSVYIVRFLIFFMVNILSIFDNFYKDMRFCLYYIWFFYVRRVEINICICYGRG